MGHASPRLATSPVAVRPEAPLLLVPLVAPGGLLVLDDFTPEAAWTPEQRVHRADDHTRTAWLRSPLWQTVGLQVSPEMALILAARRR